MSEQVQRKTDYLPEVFEAFWQQYWADQKLFKANTGSTKPKYYILDMFPYPSGAGLHVGHPLGYIATDIVHKYKMLQGYEVLHPNGFDAFGLPAEQYAIQTGTHPAITTDVNIKRYNEQLTALGIGYDKDREIRTSDPSYYKWTQWIFIQLFNHWYDEAAQKARPISELEALLDKDGNKELKAVSADGTPIVEACDFAEMNAAAREELLQNYRLAYLSDSYVNWCPALGTVLANEEVKDGVSERGGYPVIRKQMKQWSMRITAFAGRLLDGLDTIDWPEPIKEMQRHWIGRSQGALLRFKVQGSNKEIEVFTTRIDTVFGATFLTLAPEHDFVPSLVKDSEAEFALAYREAAANRSERDRMSDVKRVTGAFTGSHAINPFTNEPIPIWIADYVLAGYGTGAVMGVPSSDTRDFAFATTFNLPIIQVQEGANTDITQADFDAKAGTMINSGFLNGLKVPQAIEAAIHKAETEGWGKGKIQYKLRDAIFSRQRYWGEPFPIYFEKGLPKAMPLEALPVELPEVDQYLPTEDGDPPLGRAKHWTYQGFPIETNTMPGWAGSSWYWLRYMDPANEQALASKEAIDYWGQVDLYLGGSEHATGHLLYSRFWNHFLFDIGVVPHKEPFKKLVNQGMIQGVSEKLHLVVKGSGESRTYTFYSADVPLPALKVGETYIETVADVKLVKSNVLDIDAFKAWRPEYAQATFITAGPDAPFKTRSEVEKMSKSRYNVVNPDDVIADYSTDTMRLYEMFLGPLEVAKPWSTQGIEGTYRFLAKLWKLFVDKDGEVVLTDDTPSTDELKTLHKTIKKVGADIDALSFNTAVPAFMVCVNELTALGTKKKTVLEPLLVILSPFAPHIAEELWRKSGHDSSVFLSSWPAYNEEYLIESSFECPISINGKVRSKLVLAMDTDPAEAEALALADVTVQKWLEGKAPKKVIVVKNRMINIVL